MDRLEHSIGSIVSKIDAVLVKLDSMEKAKTKKKNTMDNILDTITKDDKCEYHSMLSYLGQIFTYFTILLLELWALSWKFSCADMFPY